MNSLKIVEMQRERIILDLLPDICQIYEKSGGTRSVVDGMLVTSPAQARTWRNGVTDIPCRVDLSRAFRPDKLKFQATEVDEFNLELPFDMVVEPTDLIHIENPNTNEIEIFEIRKKKDISRFDGTIECIIAVLGVDTDAHS